MATVEPGRLRAILNGPGYFSVGLGLFALFALKQATGLRSGVLAALQADDLYKQLSGFVLFGFVAHQWYFPLLRAQGKILRAARSAGPHKWLGALVPLLFIVHARQFGYAYQMALSLAFFTVFLTGLVNPETTGIRSDWFRPAWIVMHVGVATLLPFVVAYHVFMTYWFE
jgi:hypothetical protein